MPVPVPVPLPLPLPVLGKCTRERESDTASYIGGTLERVPELIVHICSDEAEPNLYFAPPLSPPPPFLPVSLGRSLQTV